MKLGNTVPEPIEATIVAARREEPHWGARRIRERLLRRLQHAVRVPAVSTIHAAMGQERYLCLRNNLLPVCPEWTEL